ncbi:MAG: Glycerol ABC transporter, permease protein GlpP, partial [uncultured Rubellimicrobium sp.]
EARQQPRLVPCPAGAGPCRLFGGDPADDGRELLRAGQFRLQRVLLERHLLVRRPPPQRTHVGRAGPPDPVLRHRPVDRGAARHLHRAQHAQEGLLVLPLPRPDGAAAPHPVQRGGHDLADIRPRGHRPPWARGRGLGCRLQLHARRDRRLGHHCRHGCLALDLAHRAPRLCGAPVHPRRLLPGRAHRPGEPLGRFPLHRAAQDARRPRDRDPLAVHGQLHDLHRALRRHRRRPRQCHHVPQHRPREDGARPVRPRPRGGLLAHVFPCHPSGELGLLHRDDQPRPGGRAKM